MKADTAPMTRADALRSVASSRACVRAVLPGLLLLIPFLACPPSARAQEDSRAEARVRSLQPQPWASPPSDETLSDVRAVMRAASGMTWVATGGGLVRLDGRGVTTFGGTGQTGTPAALHDVAYDGSGNLTVAAEDGAYRFDGRRFVVLSRPGTGGRPWTARELLLAHDDVLWIAASDSLLRLEPDAFTLRQGLPGVPAHLLWEDPWGYLWAASQTGPVFRRLGSAFQPVNFPLGMGDGVVRCLHVDADGHLWLIRADRAWRIEGDFERAGLPRVATPIESLTGLGITGCEVDPSGGLWLATASGLEYLAPDGSRAPMPDAGGSVRALSAAADGSLWVGTAEGLRLFVDPSFPPGLPQVLVTGTWIDGDEMVSSTEIEMPAGSEEIRLQLATPTFHEASEVRVRYRWGGADGPEADDGSAEWVELGGTELVLSDPPVGRHSLILQAGRGERWNEPGTTLWIDREPALWQTRTFWAAIGAGLAALVVWLLYLRWLGPGHTPLELPEDVDDDIVHLEDLDTDELTVSRETVERAKRNIFGERSRDD